MQIKQLHHAAGPLWDSAMSIYCEVFPQWEREPIEELKQAVDTGKSRCIVIHAGEQALGMSLTELYPQHRFAMLGYLFIAPAMQGQRLGKQLCDELFEFFDPSTEYSWLLVEAEAGPEKFYQKLGFSTFNIDYLSPHYDDQASTPMALMYHCKSQQALPTLQQLWQVVAHIFTSSYYLDSTDARFVEQRQRILSKDSL
ncbi:GNAT family N-acetyltransferase [Shewanella waksmanii]|uniref:GNAT family N-acetyltransferase n=1 Tax=Shewanella waksmanii TaxID=213783 RepID=UPI00048BD3CF|nr:GNAT family N-acetyltransferase [Shewanella waksmanii]